MNVHLVTGFTRYRKSSFLHFMTSSSHKHLLDEDACQNGESVHDSASKNIVYDSWKFLWRLKDILLARIFKSTLPSKCDANVHCEALLKYQLNINIF